MFDFLGTFNQSQFERFLAFARAQIPAVDARIAHLEFEIARVGVVAFTFEGGTPTQVSADPADSYVGKLLAAYEVQGGNPFQDLRIRLSTQPIFLVRGTEADRPSLMSNGEIVGGKGLADAPSAELMREAREWLLDLIGQRFTRLERKIRRSIDYTDQLQREVVLLGRIKAAADSPGSLEEIATTMQTLLDDPNYRAIYNDAGGDPFGLKTYAPFASYDAEEPIDPNLVNRQAGSPQRQDTGFVEKGTKGTT